MVSARPEFRVTIEHHDHETLVVVAGELDLYTADQLGERLSWLSSDDTSIVVLDLAQLTFVDAAGLRAIVRARRELHHADGGLVVRNPSPLVRRVFELAAVSDLLERSAAPDEVSCRTDVREVRSMVRSAGRWQ